MAKIKTPWRRRLLMLLCVILLFSTVFPVAAYAESGTVIIIPDEEEDDGSGGAAIIVPDNGEPTDVTISSSTVPSYFETNAFTGTWRDTGTPLHLINETGYIAYCLQTAMDSPNNSGYTKIYWWDMYSSKVANGIFAIVTNGYPNNTGGFSTEEARYATANALRFWLGECGAEGAYDWMNLKTNPNNFRGKSGYEDLFDWCVDLVEIARAETDGMPSIELSPDTITLTKSGNYYVGSTTVKLYNCSGGYSVDDYTVPSGVEIEGSTGTNGGKISVKVPASMAGESFTFCVDGINDDYEANLVYYAPNNGNEQHVVAYSPDTDAMSIYTSLTVNVPGTKVETDAPEEVLTANISIAKMDGDTREYLAGAVIALYDADKNLVEKQTTNERGGVYFSDIPLGDYYLQEIEAPAGYVLNDRMMDICLDEEMVTYMRWLYNYKPQTGSITVTKVDATGNVLSGASFLLESSADGSTWSNVVEKTTDSSGIVSFTELDSSLQYRLTETKAPPGHSLSAGVVFEGTIEGGEELSFTACDCAIPMLPFTGSNNFIPLILLAVTAGFFHITMKRRKLNEETL